MGTSFPPAVIQRKANPQNRNMFGTTLRFSLLGKEEGGRLGLDWRQGDWRYQNSNTEQEATSKLGPVHMGGARKLQKGQ